MTSRVYRSAQGKIVDLGALQLKNETVRAVGNMGVNARGDIVDGNNRSIDTKNRQVSRQYQKQTSNVSDTSLHNKHRAIQPDAVVPPPPEDFDDNFDKNSI